MGIKEKRHPVGMIDLRIVPLSVMADNDTKIKYRIPENHHVLVIDMGEEQSLSTKKSSNSRFSKSGRLPKM